MGASEKPFITVPFFTVILTFIILAVLVMFLNSKIKKQKGVKVTSKWIVFTEIFFDYFSKIVRSTLGEEYVLKFTPLALVMFGSIFLGNSLVLIGFQETATDIMFPLTWAFSMFLLWNGYGIYKMGIKGYFADFFKPMWWMFPLSIIEFFTKPLTLMIRMFGNIMSGFIMMTIILMIPEVLSQLSQILGVLGIVILIPIGGALSFYFSVFAPFIQATVFTYLVFVNMSLLINEEE